MQVRLNVWISLLVVSLTLWSCGENSKKLHVLRVQVDSLSQIVMVTDSLVKPIVYTHITELEHQPVPKAKALFISAVLPAILIAKHNLDIEREKIHKLKEKKSWVKEDSMYYDQLRLKFKASNIENLLKRMTTVPNSIVLAQAAVESGWGKSRFFKEGNNIFGMWSYNRKEARIRAGLQREGNSVYVRAYDDISQSIDDYFKTLGSARAYRDLRTALQSSHDAYELLPYLKYYSERRLEYTEQLRKIIKYNDLTKYDNYIIDPQYFVDI